MSTQQTATPCSISTVSNDLHPKLLKMLQIYQNPYSWTHFHFQLYYIERYLEIRFESKVGVRLRLRPCVFWFRHGVSVAPNIGCSGDTLSYYSHWQLILTHFCTKCFHQGLFVFKLLKPGCTYISIVFTVAMEGSAGVSVNELMRQHLQHIDSNAVSIFVVILTSTNTETNRLDMQ